jgi:glycosyltransferase involved in cell wall biosynthesis
MPVRGLNTTISVVIPTFNRSTLLARALASLPLDVDQQLEVIVIDDGSTEEISATVNCFNSRVQLIRQDRLGPGAARNRGWKAASGDYIAFLDSDDVWLPWTLQVYLEILHRFNFPSFVVGTGAWFRDESELTNVGREAIDARAFSDYLASARFPIWLGASSMLVKRECSPRFESKNMNAEDLDFALHFGQEPGFVWIQKPFTFGYRRHNSTAVMDLGKTLLGVNHLVDEEQASRYSGGSKRRNERIELITRAVRPPVIEALRQHQWSAGRSLYRRTFGWHMSLRRWRFLIAVPFLGLASALRKKTR